MKQIITAYIVILVTSVATFSSERITNITSTRTIYDFELIDGFVYLATSGGLVYYKETDGVFNVRTSNEAFPDPVVRALAVDHSGNLWVGTDEGYLMRIDPKGNEFITEAYVAANWRILDLKAVGNYLVVASNKGVSLFDMQELIVYKNAAKFEGFQSSQINVVTTFKNRLYIGGVSGVAVLKGTLDQMESRNFFDPSIWDVDTTLKMTTSYLVEDGKLNWYKTPVEMFYGNKIRAEGNTIYIYDKYAEEMEDSSETDDNTGEAFRVALQYDSDVTCLKVDGTRCFIGTENDSYFYWDGTNHHHLIIPGPTFMAVKRVYVDRNSNVWAVPIPYENENRTYAPPWWLGVNALIGSNWVVFGPKNYPEMGHMGRGINANGLLEDRDGSIWFGFEGGAIKRFNTIINRWSHYCNWGYDAFNGAFVKTYGNCQNPDWGKCDAITQDSSGYIWFSSWNNYSGCLICYQPHDDEDTAFNGLVGYYKRFPPKAYEGKNVNITAIAADDSGNVIYGTEIGEVTVITHDGNPLEDSIRTVASWGTELGLQNVFNMLEISDGSTLILTTDGVYRFDPQTNQLTYFDDFDKNITSMAVESDNVYWYASPGKGLTRFDLFNNTKRVIDKSKGLLSNDVNDVIFDKQNGYVWAATNKGISRITLGYSNFQANVTNQQVFPNPFSLRRHKVVSFQNMPTDARVTVHALNGNLVGVATQVRSGLEGAYYEWTPASDIAPGTYFFAVKSIADVKKSGKLLIVP